MSRAKDLLEKINKVTSVNEASVTVVALKDGPNKKIKEGDKGEMTIAEDGTVKVLFSEREITLDFKTEGAALQWVKVTKAEKKVSEVDKADKEALIAIIRDSKGKKPFDLFDEKGFEDLFNKLDMTFTELGELIRVHNPKLN